MSKLYKKKFESKPFCASPLYKFVKKIINWCYSSYAVGNGLYYVPGNFAAISCMKQKKDISRYRKASFK